MLKKDVIDHYGSVSAIAESLGITPQAVSMWPEVVPLSRQWQIEILTSGSLKADTQNHSHARAASPRT